MFMPAMWFGGGTIREGVVCSLERFPRHSSGQVAVHVGACGKAEGTHSFAIPDGS